MKRNLPLNETSSFCCFRNLFLLLGIFYGVCSNAQTHKPRTVTINSNCGGYYEYLPANYSTSTKYFPVIFYIPSYAAIGSGSSTDLKKVLNESIPYYIYTNKFPKSFTVNNVSYSFVVISPQFKKWPTAADVKAVIDYIIYKKYKIEIDQSRLYVSGYSAGGDATLKYAGSGDVAAKRLAAIAPGAPYIYPYTDKGAIYIARNNLPAWFMHGANDTQAPTRWSTDFVKKINSYNPAIKAKVTLLSGLVHNNAWKKMYDPAFRVSGYNVYEWLLLYKRGTSQYRTTDSVVYENIVQAQPSSQQEVTAMAENNIVTSAEVGAYPNPTSGLITLKVNNAHRGTMRVVIFDPTGNVRKQFNLVKDRDYFTRSISLTDLSKGNYILQVQMDNWKQTTKINKL
jgi:hypothetical protein